ncbi:MAG: hypothetical protein ACTHW1_00610 [Ancrocorticia sp.]|uniref:hypothetical protein n=1 Tax=Ancrocorticia sp. TaxID=2593684 RepID=UPI003F8FE541
MTERRHIRAPWRRQPGETLSIGQLFTLIALWCGLSVGVAGGLAAVIAFAVGRGDWGIAAVISGLAVIVSFALTAVIVRVGSGGGVATGIAYAVKVVITACVVVWLGRMAGVDDIGLVVTLIVGEMIALGTMVAVVMRAEGPGLDIDES